MMRRTRRFAPRMGAVLGILACLLTLVPAAAQEAGGFSVHAVLPDNQVDIKQTYFDLRMDPGQRQTVELVITNSRAEAMEADITLNTASTGRNGLILYGIPEGVEEAADIRRVAALRQSRVVVPPAGSYTVQIDLTMPREGVEGVLLGGITIREAPREDEARTAGLTVENAIAYVVALKVTTGEGEPPPDFALVSVNPALIDYRPTVVAQLRNLPLRIVKDMRVSAQVYGENAASPLHTLACSNAHMAPGSTGDFVIDWGGEALRQGNYRLRMTATYEGRVWEWEESFVVGPEAEAINSGAVGLKRDFTWLYAVAGILLLLLVWRMAYGRGRRTRPES